MNLSKKTIYLALNSIFCVYGLLSFTAVENFLFMKTILVTLIMYLLPGYAWINNQNEDSGLILKIFKIFAASIAILFFSHCFLVITNLSLSRWTLVFLLMIISNLGIFINKNPIPLPNLWRNKTFQILLIFIILITGVFYISMKKIEMFRDLDGEHFTTSYGLIKEIKPYLNSDIVVSTFYFAHPTLTNLFNAYSILLFGQIDHYKIYYQSAKAAREILQLKPDQTKEFQHQNGHLSVTKNINGTYTVYKNGKLLATYNVEGLIRYFYNLDYKCFHYAPMPYYSRASNLFANLFCFLIIYAFIYHFTKLPFLSTLGGLIYITSPGILIRVSLSEHLAFTNCFIALLLYQAIIWNNDALKKTSGSWIAYLPGAISGLMNQKIIILIFTIFLLRAYEFIKERHKYSITNILTFEPIITGYFIGMFAFWTYGLLIDAPAFLQSHIHTHFFDRIAHYNSLFLNDYPSLLQLWKEFLFEFPAVLISLIGAVFIYKDLRKNPSMLLGLYILIGGGIYSLVDWKQTNHLMCLVPAFILLSFLSFQKMDRTPKIILTSLILGTLCYNVYADINLMNHFNTYIPTSGW